MRIYLQPPQPSRGLQRIATALTRYAPPEVEVVDHPKLADLTIVYAIGRRDKVQRQVEEIRSRGKHYAIVQVCLKSTMNPDVRDWVGIWERAKVLWSYYDLFRIALEDGLYIQGMDNFYHAPLGADSTVFYSKPVEKEFIIGTCGLSRLQESVRECIVATAEVGQRMFHLGMDMTFYSQYVTWGKNLIDEQVANEFSRCHFVSALRRKEGFELPGIEGLLCGARPICFDTPDYRWNYQDHAEYIQETDRQGVVDQLVELFRAGARPVTTEERERAVKRFNWQTIISGFYERVL